MLQRRARLVILAGLLTTLALTGLWATLDHIEPGGRLPTVTPPPSAERRTPSPVTVEPNQRQSVVLVSLGGVSGQTLADWMIDGAMPTLAHLAGQGQVITTLRSIDPPLPQLALAALASGAPSSDAPPLWQTADRQGRTTALLFWPGSDTTTDYALSCDSPPITSGRQTTTLLPREAWPGAPASFGPTYGGSLTLPTATGSAPWAVLAMDSRDDGQTDLDTFLFTPDQNGQQSVTRDTPQLQRDGWVALPVAGRTTPELMLNVTSLRPLTPTPPLSPTADLTTTTGLTPTAIVPPPMELTVFYLSAQPLTAQPAWLGQEVILRFGFCPPLPDAGSVAQGWLPAPAFAELLTRRARWNGQVAAYVYQSTRPHLMLVRQEAMLLAGQGLLLSQPEQAGFSQTRAAQFATQRRAVAHAIDASLSDLLTVIDLNLASVTIVSEHGLAPVHTQVNLTAALQPIWQRLQTVDGGLLPPQTTLRLQAMGGFVAIEIELAGQQDLLARQAIAQTLAALLHPQTREAVFARVAARAAAADWASAWPQPDDIVAQAAPGYSLAATQDTTAIFSAASIYGQTGYPAHLPAMPGAWIVSDQVWPKSDHLAQVWDIAPALAAWLGLSNTISR
ncbi:MAG: hypothetical protein ACOYZ7_17420 [Chloroflexota bacterium]